MSTKQTAAVTSYTKTYICALYFKTTFNNVHAVDTVDLLLLILTFQQYVCCQPYLGGSLNLLPTVLVPFCL